MAAEIINASTVCSKDSLPKELTHQTEKTTSSKCPYENPIRLQNIGFRYYMDTKPRKCTQTLVTYNCFRSNTLSLTKTIFRKNVWVEDRINKRKNMYRSYTTNFRWCICGPLIQPMIPVTLVISDQTKNGCILGLQVFRLCFTDFPEITPILRCRDAINKHRPLNKAMPPNYSNRPPRSV